MNCHCRKRKCKRQLSLLGSASFPAPKFLGRRPPPSLCKLPPPPTPALACALTQLHFLALAGQKEHLQYSFRSPGWKVSEVANPSCKRGECVCLCVCVHARVQDSSDNSCSSDCFAQLKSWHLIQNVKSSPPPHPTPHSVKN